jgi:uncharacterized membrane protein YagU involved in acid resistance
MTVAMLLLHVLLPWRERDPLPPAQITRNLTEGRGLGLDMNRPRHRWMSWALHFGFGTVGGGLYAPLAQVLPGPPVVRGIVYALGVWASSYLGWIPAANILPPAHKHPAGRNLLMIVAHIVWGSILGILVAQWDEPEGADSYAIEWSGGPPLGEPDAPARESPHERSRSEHDGETAGADSTGPASGPAAGTGVGDDAAPGLGGS